MPKKQIDSVKDFYDIESDKSLDYSEIFKNTSIILLSSMLAMLLGIVRSKILAITYGPEGIGKFGLVTAAAGLLIDIGLLGVAINMTRELAAIRLQKGDKIQSIIGNHSLIAAISTFFCLLTIFAVMTYCPTIVRAPVFLIDAKWVIAISVLLGVLTNIGYSIIRGLRLVYAQAGISIAAASLSTVIFLVLLVFGNFLPVTIFVIVPFAATAICSWIYIVRDNKLGFDLSRRLINGKSLILLALTCFPLLLTSIIGDLYAVAVRALVYKFSDARDLGLLQACLALSELYVAFLLAAMAADFFPKLSAVDDKSATFSKMINHQIEICTILAAVALIPGIVFSKLVLLIAYGHSFVVASSLLQCLMLAALLRTMSWPLILSILSRGYNKISLFIECGTFAALLFLSVLMQKYFGIFGISLAYLAVYAAYFCLSALISYIILPFRFDRATMIGGLICLTSAALTLFLQLQGNWVYNVMSYIAATGGVVFCVFELKRMGILQNVTRPLARTFQVRKK